MKSALLRCVYPLSVSLVACTLTPMAWGQAAAPAPAPAAAPAATAPVTVAAPAAPPAPEPPKYPITTITGFVEAAYHVSLDDSGNAGILPLHAYDTANGFQLHTAHLQLKHQATEHVMAQIEFEAGSDAAFNNGSHFTSSPQLFDVLEAFASYSNDGFTLTAGKFVTYEGIEVVPGPSNPTITRGLLYTWAEPITHVGAKLHYATGPVDLGVGVVNGWDTNGVVFTGDNNDQKTFIFRAAITPVPQFFAALSGSYGVENTVPGNANPRLSLDLTGAVIPSDTVTINFQGNYGSEKGTGGSWLGFGVQPLIKFGAASLGARLEYFADKLSIRTALLPGTDVNFVDFTVTPGYTFDNAFTLRAEFRYDTASEAVLVAGKKNESSVAISAHYVF
jgi:hypothetical protein